jgi:hypothetical protein
VTASTPAELRAQADQLMKLAEAARDQDDARQVFVLMHQVTLLRELACEMERQGRQELTRRSPDVQDTEMTDAQLARRGRAVARAAADVSEDHLLKAIANDPRWGSQAVYARDRLKISPASLTHYRTGVSPCPRRVDRMVREDFPAIFKDRPGKGPLFRWLRGVTE